MNLQNFFGLFKFEVSGMVWASACDAGATLKIVYSFLSTYCIKFFCEMEFSVSRKSFGKRVKMLSCLCSSTWTVQNMGESVQYLFVILMLNFTYKAWLLYSKKKFKADWMNCLSFKLNCKCFSLICFCKMNTLRCLPFWALLSEIWNIWMFVLSFGWFK